jgi:hypothetical protein
MALVNRRQDVGVPDGAVSRRAGGFEDEDEEEDYGPAGRQEAYNLLLMSQL